MKVRILDCTIRDGGYYTDWDFSPNVVDGYIDAINKLPIDYIEVGYRNPKSHEYLGEYGYCPKYVLENIRKKCNKKIAVMVNEKSVKAEEANALLASAKGLVDMIRISVNPRTIDSAILLAKAIKEMGFEVGFNTMYMSTWSEIDFYPKLKGIENFVDVICMVDSFGGVSPEDVKDAIRSIRKYTNVSIGFHGHNNLEQSLINTLTAIEEDVDFVDATILGMGRGAGNLKMELLLTVLNKRGLEVDFNVLGNVISLFSPLLDKYKWGTNLPYMLSGANSFPQKEVMQMVTNRVYSFNSIVRALNNRKENVEDNAKFPVIPDCHYAKTIIIGGGDNSVTHYNGIREFIEKEKSDTALIFATCRNAIPYNDLTVDKFYCLVGNEGMRLSKNVGTKALEGKCILPPYPRVMGTDVPEFVKNVTFELPEISFTNQFVDSCTTVAVQLALLISDNVYIVGYDGYPEGYKSEKERELTLENRAIFTDAHKFIGKSIVSLTPTLYSELDLKSVYQYL